MPVPAARGPTGKDPTMAKEQKRGNKEARKPKGNKKTPAVPASASSLMTNGVSLARMPKAKA